MKLESGLKCVPIPSHHDNFSFVFGLKVFFFLLFPLSFTLLSLHCTQNEPGLWVSHTRKRSKWRILHSFKHALHHPPIRIARRRIQQHRLYCKHTLLHCPHQPVAPPRLSERHSGSPRHAAHRPDQPIHWAILSHRRRIQPEHGLACQQKTAAHAQRSQQPIAASGSASTEPDAGQIQRLERPVSFGCALIRPVLALQDTWLHQCLYTKHHPQATYVYARQGVRSYCAGPCPRKTAILGDGWEHCVLRPAIIAFARK